MRSMSDNPKGKEKELTELALKQSRDLYMLPYPYDPTSYSWPCPHDSFDGCVNLSLTSVIPFRFTDDCLFTAQ